MKKLFLSAEGALVRTLATDLFMLEKFKDSHITLMDINKCGRLYREVLNKIIREMKVLRAKCGATTDRRKRLRRGLCDHNRHA